LGFISDGLFSGFNPLVNVLGYPHLGIHPGIPEAQPRVVRAGGQVWTRFLIQKKVQAKKRLDCPLRGEGEMIVVLV
jgi:hypothetical protein